MAKTNCGKALPYKTEMAALNSARVSFKHHGVEPSLAEAEKHISAAHRFLQDAALQFFDTDFDTLSEADLVSDDAIRTALKAAEGSLIRGDARGALQSCRDALDALEASRWKSIPVSEHHFGPNVPREIQPFTDKIVDWVERHLADLQHSVRMSLLGVNPAEYLLLKESLPLKSTPGHYLWSSSTQRLTRAQTCMRIITNWALRLDRVRADLKRLEERAGLSDARRRFKERPDNPPTARQ